MTHTQTHTPTHTPSSHIIPAPGALHRSVSLPDKPGHACIRSTRERREKRRGEREAERERGMGLPEVLVGPLEEEQEGEATPLQSSVWREGRAGLDILFEVRVTSMGIHRSF